MMSKIKLSEEMRVDLFERAHLIDNLLRAADGLSIVGDDVNGANLVYLAQAQAKKIAGALDSVNFD